jgi:hypothetical protein
VPEWSLEALRLLEVYLDLVAAAARGRGLCAVRSVAWVRARLTACAERGAGGPVRPAQLLAACGELGSPGQAAELGAALCAPRGESRDAQPA